MSHRLDVRNRSLPIAEALAEARTDWPTTATLTWWSFTTPSLVLGSGQEDSIVDRQAADAAGVVVARRASGGGAVLLVPDAVVWADLVIPRSDPRWDDDVVAATNWVGAAWVDALGSSGVAASRLTRHIGRSVVTPWSSLVCFAGLGPGEVCLGGRKVVGMSQRRSRAGARFQMAVLRRWDPDALVSLLALEPAARATLLAALAQAATGVDVEPSTLREAFAQHVA